MGNGVDARQNKSLDMDRNGFGHEPDLPETTLFMIIAGTPFDIFPKTQAALPSFPNGECFCSDFYHVESGKQVHERVRVDRFDHVPIEPGLFRFFLVILLPPTGDGDED